MLQGRDDIHVYEPTGRSPYYQIGWTEDSRWRTTSGGRTIESATEKANAIAERLDTDARQSVNPVSALCEAWLNPNRKRRVKWSPKHAQECRRVMDSYVIPVIGTTRCGTLNKRDVQRAVSAAKTQGEGDRTRRIFGTALRWGYRNGWLVSDPERLLSDVYWGSGKQDITSQGASALTIPAAAIPSTRAVEELAWGMAWLPSARSQDVLAVFLAAYTGLRLGELLALQVGDIDLARGRIDVRRQVIEVKGGCRITPPKRNKVRQTILPTVVPGGYRLLDGVAERIAEIGGSSRSPEAPLLMAPRGGIWVPSRWAERRVRPAARSAEWETFGAVRGGREITRFVWTWHSLRHVFASWLLWDLEQSPADVASAMGHESVSITLEMYASNPSNALDRLSAATGG